MALNIHTDSEFEKRLEWLSRHSNKTKTAIIKELIFERYRVKKEGFRFGSLKSKKRVSSSDLQSELKELDEDSDLD